MRLIRHVLFVRGKYFVIYDDIETSKAATFTWLYHVLPEQPFQFDAAKVTADYAVGKVKVRVAHTTQPDLLVMEDLTSLDAMTNRFTGEDYRKYVKPGPLPAHNLWVSNRAPKTQFQFLAVIYPYRDSDASPLIESAGDGTVRVTFEGRSDVITFSPDTSRVADFSVDAAAIKAGSRP
jgi:hypothetical protein